LDAVLADIDKRKPGSIYCLGDLVGYNVAQAAQAVENSILPNVYADMLRHG
jgi:hypothetical protein